MQLLNIRLSTMPWNGPAHLAPARPRYKLITGCSYILPILAIKCMYRYMYEVKITLKVISAFVL